LDDFLDLLAAHDIRRLADIRRFPASRRHPHFSREALAAACLARGLEYRHFEALGGRRRAVPGSPHRAWTVDAFRGYADYMDTAEFAEALASLLSWASPEPTVVLCAEALPFKCHRRLLSDAVLVRGWTVEHILARGRTEPHRMTPFARVEGERLAYDGGQGEM
jgi:uncharacterized protein (DUF488 family)